MFAVKLRTAIKSIQLGHNVLCRPTEGKEKYLYKQYCIDDTI